MSRLKYRHNFPLLRHGWRLKSPVFSVKKLFDSLPQTPYYHYRDFFSMQPLIRGRLIWIGGKKYPSKLTQKWLEKRLAQALACGFSL